MTNIPVVHSLTSDDTDVLNSLEYRLRERFTRIWPGREHPSCPPAVAAAVHPLHLSRTSLIQKNSDAHTVIVFLPRDWMLHLDDLGTEVVWRVHRDVGRPTKRAYASWTCQSPGVPRSIWLGLTPLISVMEANTPPDACFFLYDSWGAPVWFIARGRAVRRNVSIHFDKRYDLADEICAPLDEDEDLERILECCGAAREAGLQPWLHARHELFNAGQRLDALLAPLAVPSVCRVHSSVCPLGGFTLD